MTNEVWSRHQSLLRCPTSGQALSVLGGEEIAQANAAIGARHLRHANDEARALEGSALGTPDRKIIYRIEDGIACLLPDLAIAASHEAKARDRDSAQVRRFYDEYGWVKNKSDRYNDTEDFTDQHTASAYYGQVLNRRVARQLRSGRYLLDAASGAALDADYMPYSENYDFRLCVDFSITALREARARLGTRGLYVLGDITCLPFASDSVDDVISLHTIYHVPRAMAVTAVDELVRVTRPGGRVVIVAAWAWSPLMNAAMKAKAALGNARRILLAGPRPAAPSQDQQAQQAPQEHELYYAPFDYERYLSEIASRHDTTLRLWASTSLPFQKAFFADNRFGLLSAKLVLAAEQWLEPIAARYGQYPMFVVSKRLAGERQVA